MSGTMKGITAYSSGKAQKKAAYANANSIEAQSRGNLIQTGAEMKDLSSQGEQAMGNARASQGGSGLTSDGTGSTKEQRIAGQLANQLQVSSENAAVQDLNARYQSKVTRWEGDVAKKQGMASLITGMVSDGISVAMAFATAGMSTAAQAGGTLAGGAAGAAAGSEATNTADLTSASMAASAEQTSAAQATQNATTQANQDSMTFGQFAYTLSKGLFRRI